MNVNSQRNKLLLSEETAERIATIVQSEAFMEAFTEFCARHKLEAVEAVLLSVAAGEDRTAAVRTGEAVLWGELPDELRQVEEMWRLHKQQAFSTRR